MESNTGLKFSRAGANPAVKFERNFMLEPRNFAGKICAELCEILRRKSRKIKIFAGRLKIRPQSLII